MRRARRFAGLGDSSARNDASSGERAPRVDGELVDDVDADGGLGGAVCVDASATVGPDVAAIKRRFKALTAPLNATEAARRCTSSAVSCRLFSARATRDSSTAGGAAGGRGARRGRREVISDRGFFEASTILLK